MAKLVEILARELKEWPGNYPHALLTQSVSGWVGYVINNKARWSAGDGFTLAEDWVEAIVTRAEWQAAVDALKAKEVGEWDGVGLPPVGTVCENVFPSEIWREVIIIAHDGDMAVFRLNNSERLNYFADTNQHFRPIRTPEQIAAEEREAEVNRMVATVPMLDKGWARKVCYALYDNNYRKQEQK